MRFPVLNAAVFCLVLGCYSIAGQSPCSPPSVIFNNNSANLFNEIQEKYLGEVIAEYVQKNYRVIEDEQANRYLRAIGDRLVKNLPPTGIEFHFFVVDLPELNAFAAPGGRIYVTRKLIAFVKNEDELAGILGHELGHAFVRHGSIDVSRRMKEVLKVTALGDKADIYNKYHQLIDRRNTRRVKFKRNHDDEQQLEADRIGLHSMAAAGYDPAAYTTAWDRLAETKGKTGNAFSDLFGTTKPEEKRLRELMKATEKIPDDCLDKSRIGNAAEFARWQSYVVTTSRFEKTERLTSLVDRKELYPYLRGEVRHFEFSPDGQFIIAQDFSGINILRRDPFEFVFRIDAENAKFATFSPDSRNVVFQTFGLRVEKWLIDTRKPVSAREVHVRGSCWQSALSPDGEHLVCYAGDGSLKIISVETNEIVTEKKEFYTPSFFEYLFWVTLFEEGDDREVDALQMEFSPDGRYFLAGRVFRFGLGARALASGFYFAFSPGLGMNQDAFLAYDLSSRKEMKLAGELKNIVARPFAFYANDRIIGQHRKDPDKSGIFTFPEGKQVERFYMNADSYTRTHKGDYILVRPTTTNPVGVFDFKNQKFVASNKTEALAGYGNFFISEGKDGAVDLYEIDRASSSMNNRGTLFLPKNDFGDIRSVSFSPDMKWLLVSESARAGIWDLSDGRMKQYVRGVRGSHFDGDGKVYIDVPRSKTEPRTMAVINMADGSGEKLDELQSPRFRQFGKHLVKLTTKQEEEQAERLAKQRAKNKKNGDTPPESDAPGGGRSGPTITIAGAFAGISLSRGGEFRKDGTLEVYDAASRNLLWSRKFEDEIPQYRFDVPSETVILYWRVTTRAAKAQIRARPDLDAKAKELGDKDGDFLVLVLDSNTGAQKGAALIETGEGSFSIERVLSAGNWLAIIDTENRVLLYSLADGELVWRFFGSDAALNPQKDQIVIENFAGQISVYDLATGEKTDDLLFKSSVAFLRFGPRGERLFVLTGDQEYMIFDTAGFGKPDDSRIGTNQ